MNFFAHCSMHETITWTRISLVVRSKIKEIYREQLIQQMCAHRILGTAPVSSDQSSKKHFFLSILEYRSYFCIYY